MLRLFSCCFRRRDASDDHLDYVNERSHLIPASSELPSPTTLSQPDAAAAIDHQRVKDRMESIVRAKESKMVNVNARLPFNLHNLPSASSISHTAHHNPHNSSSSFSSSSRSESRSHSNTLAAYGHAHTPMGTLPRANSQVQVHVGAPLPVDSAPPSASASASRGPQVHYAGQDDISRSSSMASRDTGEDSLARRRAQPILGLRLVKIPMKESSGDLVGRRGRRKKKAVEEGVDVDRLQVGEGEEMNATTPTPQQDDRFKLNVETGGEGTTPRPTRLSPSHHHHGSSYMPRSQGHSDATMSRSLDSPVDDLDTPRLETKDSIHTDSTSTPRLETTTRQMLGSESLEICISPASGSTFESPRSVENVLGGDLSSLSKSGDEKESENDGSEDGEEGEGASKPMKIKTSQQFVLRDDGPITVSWGD